MAQLKNTDINGDLTIKGIISLVDENGNQTVINGGSGSIDTSELEKLLEKKPGLIVQDEEGNTLGEIFNTYDGEYKNQALGPYSLVHGYNNIAGHKGFHITEIMDNVTYNDTYAIVIIVDGTGYRDNYALGDYLCIKTSSFHYKKHEIISFQFSYLPPIEEGSEVPPEIITIDNCIVVRNAINPENVPESIILKEDPDGVENWLWVEDKSYGYPIKAFRGTSVGGEDNVVFGRSSATQGRENKVLSDYGSAFGRENTVSYAAFAAGRENKAMGEHSVALGKLNESTGNHSYTEGIGNKATNVASHAEGAYTVSEGEASHAEGCESISTGNYAHAEGYKNNAVGNMSHAEGSETHATGDSSHTEGHNTYATEICAHAEGSGTTASGKYAHAQGYGSKATGEKAHAEGWGTISSGFATHSEGKWTEAIGNYSHVEGSGSSETYKSQATVNAKNAHVEGYYNIADGFACHVEGQQNQATGVSTHVEGQHNIGYAGQHIQGKYNIKDTEGTYVHIVGDGTNDSNRSNAHTLDWSGNAWFKGSVTSNGADYAEYFEWLDGNPDNEDRVGLLVALDGEKIRLANADEEILGIISGTAAILGDNYECEWNGKYLTDNFGRVIYDMVEEFSDEIVGEDEEGNPIIEKQSLGFFKHPLINPNYNPEQAYINRSDRPEWDAVGMLGKLYVRDDGTCIPNYYATVGENGIVTLSLEKTNMRVLSRVNENIVRVLLK